MFTPHQSAYFAYWLTQTGKIENQVSRVMASARVDMNPHQIEAARFALQSPLSKGVLLADEVGLGKTIEASLVIAQKWAERKKQILLIVPASLRKQWNQELLDKFDLPSLVLDSKVVAELKKQGQSRPFEQQENIVICSYDYAARQSDQLKLVDWHLVVFDEAHKLRNIHQKGKAKRANAVVDATAHADSRVLLSATPLQNNLMELYGLSQVIDPHYFGDEKSFRSLYANRKNNKEALQDLKKRIEPLCHRTLRKQVQQEGGINFTNRYSLTQDFTPSDEEWQLHQSLSDYLQAPDNIAISEQAKHLVSIGLRKILASSSFAVAETLKSMVTRLKLQQQVNEESLTDLEAADEWLDADLGQQEQREQRNEPSRLQQEIELLSQCQQMAENITKNAKGEALLTVLGKAMDMTENLGGLRKAVIFTESCRTQQYLLQQLESNGYAGRAILLNGSNIDENSQKIYRQWLEYNDGTARISGSKTADMKAALVEHFKSNQADILISTEAGGEGINLQFCSVLINYDLPWNPQKVEQRIGRVHRYGQKNDVVVVNFVNRKNPADKRVFQLLNEKLKLFEGVFGASDEVLGAIEGNIDIEKRIYEIYQKCRSDEDIEAHFNQLQQDMGEQLEVREKEARYTLLNHFDRDVVAALKTRRDESNDFLKEYERMLLDLAKAELPDASFKANHFHHQGKRYDLSWPLTTQHHSEFFRLQASEHFLAWDIVRHAKAHVLNPVHLTLHYDQLEGHYSALQPFIGQSGKLCAIELIFSFNKNKTEHRKTLVLAMTDNQERLPPKNAEQLLFIPAQSSPIGEPISEHVFAQWKNEELQQQRAQTEEELDTYLERETEKLERWAQDKRNSLFENVDQLDEDIRQLKKDARLLASTREKIEAKKALRKLERKRDDALSEYHSSKKQIEEEEDRLLDEVSEKLTLTYSVRELFSATFTLSH